MISKMAFGVPRVRDFLSSSGHVVTVRGFYYKTPRAVVPDLADIPITRRCLGEIVGENDLKPFLPLSGFASVRTWYAQIMKFCKGRKWLYLVQIDHAAPARMERDNEKREQQKLTRFYPATQTPHPLDRLNDSRDPADVDLAPFRATAHADRMQREQDATQRRHEAMRKKYQEHGEIKTTIKPLKGQDILMITGNRRLNDPESIRRQLNALIDERRPDMAISGMAIGADQLFAEICIEKGIPVHAYIPFLGQDNRWSTSMKARYNDILSHCEKKVIVCDSASIAAFQTRNVAMVDASTRAIAVYDGKPGGTKNCIRVLDRESKPYVTIENIKRA